MAKKKQLSKDLYAIAKKCPHLQLCKSTKKGTWLDCRLKKGCACSPGASYCTQVKFPLSVTEWLVNTPDFITYQQKPRVNWAISTRKDNYKERDDQSIKNFLGEMEQDVQEKEDEKSTITDKQLDEMIANLSDEKDTQEIILETVQSLRKDMNLINEKLTKLESTSELNKYKQTLGDAFLAHNMGDHVSGRLNELNSPETQQLRYEITTCKPKKANAYLVHPGFRPVCLYKKDGHYSYSYYNEILGREVISNVTTSTKFVTMDELNTSLYRRFQELVESTRKNYQEKKEILQQLRGQVIDL